MGVAWKGSIRISSLPVLAVSSTGTPGVDEVRCLRMEDHYVSIHAVAGLAGIGGPLAGSRLAVHRNLSPGPATGCRG